MRPHRINGYVPKSTKSLVARVREFNDILFDIYNLDMAEVSLLDLIGHYEEMFSDVLDEHSPQS